MKLHSIGFRIKKTEENMPLIRTWKRELSIKKNTIKGYGPPAKPFGVYRETEKYLYMPRFFEHGQEYQDIRTDGTPINVEFKGQLRQLQLNVEKLVMDELREVQRTILCLKTGYGKCHALNTPILMHDGTIKMVQDIKVGDKVMGEDSQARTVLSLGRGKDQMYEICPTKGESFIVNSEHILSLKVSGNNVVKYNTPTKTGYQVNYVDTNILKRCSKRFDNYDEAKDFLNSWATIVDIPLNKYLELNKTMKHVLKLYRVGIDFPEQYIGFDPYIIGLWLGDGSSRTSTISNQDATIIKYLKETLRNYDMYLQYTGAQYDYRMISINHRQFGQPLLAELNRCNLIQNKHIPECYKINTRDIRLQVLAGLIDSDGHHIKNTFSITQKNERMADDIVYLVRSLGLAAYKSIKRTSWTHKGIKKFGSAFRISISGDLSIIPTKVKRKQATVREQCKNTLVSGFKVIQKEYDNYYGIAIDGNHRYLLGDFTVTHNTICGLKFLANLQRKTLIVVHTHFLMKQWEDRIKQFLPNAKIGFFYGPKCDIEGKDIIIGMLQSLSLKDYNPKIFKDIGFTIFDEVHKVGAEQFSKALLRVSSKYVLGLSATPYRGDGLTRILYLHFGKILDPIKQQKLDQNVHVNIVPYEPENFRETRIRFGGYNFANMTNQLVEDKKRNELIIETAMEYVEEGRSILILSARIEHVRLLAQQLDFLGVSVGIFIGGMKMDDLESATEKQVIVATYNMFKEGVDVQKLNTLIFATPISKITQAVGRILRKKHEDHTPLIIDIWDVVSQFEKWGLTRQKYYKSKKFITNLDDYEHKTRDQLEDQPIDVSCLTSDDEDNN